MSKVKKYVPADIPGGVDAIQYEKDYHLVVAAWCGGEVHPPYDNPRILVPHIYGNSIAKVGDWVVRSQKDGRFRVMSDEEFKKAYQAKPVLEFDHSKIYVSGGSTFNV